MPQSVRAKSAKNTLIISKTGIKKVPAQKVGQSGGVWRNFLSGYVKTRIHTYKPEGARRPGVYII